MIRCEDCEWKDEDASGKHCGKCIEECTEEFERRKNEVSRTFEDNG